MTDQKPKSLSLTPATALSAGIIVIALAIAITIALPGDAETSTELGLNGIKHTTKRTPMPVMGESPTPSPSAGETPNTAPPAKEPPKSAPPETGSVPLAEYPAPNMAWEMDEFPRLMPPEGYTYYETEDGVGIGETFLTRFAEEDWPRLYDLTAGTVLVSTGNKRLRSRPTSQARLFDYEANTCFEVKDGKRYYYLQQTERRSGGWVPVKQVDCPRT